MTSLKLNEAGQLLLPLVGINRKTLMNISSGIEKIGIKDGKLGILANEVLKIENYPIKGTKYIYLLEPLPEYKIDFNKLLDGNYVGISKKAKILILSNLINTKKEWRGILYNSEEAVKDKLRKVLGTRPRLEDTVNNLYELVDLKKFSAYKPLKELDLNIENLKDQLKIFD
jgi:hypothetical protein